MMMVMVMLARSCSISVPCCFSGFSHPPPSSPCAFSSYLSNRYKRETSNYCCSGSITRPRILPNSAFRDAFGLRVFVVSDLHTDYPENMDWVKNWCLSANKNENDILLVAGDVAETYTSFYLTMSLFKDTFQHVFFVPGNHDLWCRREDQHYLDSLGKLNKVLDACRGLGVQTKPMAVGGLGIVPLFSWYHESFDRERDITGIRIPSLEMVIHFLFSLYARTFMHANGQQNSQTEIPVLRVTLMQ